MRLSRLKGGGDLKRKILIVQIVILLSLSSCVNSGVNNNNQIIPSTNNIQESISDSSEDAISNDYQEKETAENEEPTDNKEEQKESTFQWGFGLEDLYIDNKPLLSISFDELLNTFGEPDETKVYKVRPPATEPGVYNYFSVAVYKDYEVEFYTEDIQKSELSSADVVFRFDITGNNVELNCGLKVGMTIDEIINKYGNREVYSIKVEKESYELNSIRHVLTSYKPENYYSNYEKAMIVNSDPDKLDGFYKAMSLVLLIKDDKVDRIVFGYPTSG